MTQAEQNSAVRTRDAQTIDLYKTTDAAVWAEQFNSTAVHLGYSDMDINWLTGWFANAMGVAELRVTAELNKEAEERSAVEQNMRTRDEIPVYSPARKKTVYEHFHEGRWQRIPYHVFLDLRDSECRMRQEDLPALVRLKDVNIAMKKAEDRGAAEQRRKDAEGYLFDNPDTGTEYLPYHPIESGECQYAENIRKATAAELLATLNDAWDEWKYERDEKKKNSANIAAMEARIAELEEAMSGVVQYCEDTLDGPVKGDEDMAWHREGVEEIQKRARATLTREGGV